MGFTRLPCEKRDFLLQQHRDLHQAKIELESRLAVELVSVDERVRARASKQVRYAEDLAFQAMFKLASHLRKHGCATVPAPEA